MFPIVSLNFLALAHVVSARALMNNAALITNRTNFSNPLNASKLRVQNVSVGCFRSSSSHHVGKITAI